MVKENAKDARASRQRAKFKPLVFCLLVILGSMLLTACSIDSPRIITPTPPPQKFTPTAAIQPTITPLPPLPTATPRPTLEAVPGGLKSAKETMLKESFDAVIASYYFPVSSADIYQVALRGISNTLQTNGIQAPQVSIPDFSNDGTKDWNSFYQAYQLTLSRYQGQISEEKLAYGAIQATVNSLSDCQTKFYAPTDAQSYLQNITGLATAVGLGIIVSPYTGGQGLYITRVTPQGPADKAGLKVGDAIQGIDGQTIVGIPLANAFRLLVGGDRPTPGTNVNLEIRKAGTGNIQKIDITRGSTNVQIFETQVLGNIGYLRINSFPNRAGTLLDEVNNQLDSKLKDFNDQKLKGIVIDLRGTRYGNWRTVISFLSRFTQSSEILAIASQDDKHQPNKLAVSTVKGVTPINKPLAILVDNTTASEGEMFAFALQSKKVAQIFGQDTAGCAVGSDVVNLSDNSLLNLARFRVIADNTQPDGYLDRVTPDIAVDQDVKMLEQGKDAILERAISYLKAL